jgi:hypothetical protein
MSRSRALRAGGLAAALAVGMVLSGCSGQVACPAIGYLDTFTVHVTGPDAATAAVELCDGQVCTVPISSPAPMPTPVHLTPGPGAEGSALTSVRASRTGTKWDFIGTFPVSFEVRAIAPDGTTLVREPVVPKWRRVGGTSECGGPHAASVTLRVPAH